MSLEIFNFQNRISLGLKNVTEQGIPFPKKAPQATINRMVMKIVIISLILNFNYFQDILWDNKLRRQREDIKYELVQSLLTTIIIQPHVRGSRSMLLFMIPQ